MYWLILHWDTATWHTDFDWNPVVGIVDASDSKVIFKWKKVATKDSILNFPSHKHSAIWDYSTHSVSIWNIWTWKVKLNWYSLIRKFDQIVVEWQTSIFQTTNVDFNSN